MPVAITGMACRFPGGARTPEAYWALLREGRSGVVEVPRSRWDIEAYYDPDPAAPGRMSTRHGGFVDEHDLFDAGFFSISPREAATMDPQQRLLLLTAYEALEDAGLPVSRIAGSRGGVFMGMSADDYRVLTTTRHMVEAYSGTGLSLSIGSNRISYFFDLHGPSLTVDTACSSSLVAVHLACESIRRGESEFALAGGVNLLLVPGTFVGMCKAGFLAPDGACKSFSAAANGYVRGEGSGVVVLKPLSRALADGDRIYAVVRGSAVNQDGRTNGLTAPSGQAQEAVLRAAYAAAGVAPSRVRYVETHGTGTPIGDPIEAKALGRVMGEGRDASDPCLIGSVKTNIGHLEPAAGIASLIKAALVLTHAEVPPSLHFDRPNPAIAFDQLKLRVQTEHGPIERRDGPLVAGVASFGFGGTNSHVVLEEPPAQARALPPRPDDESRRAHVLCLSTKAPEALREGARRFAALLASPASPSLEDVCATAETRRSLFRHRLAVVGRDRAAIAESLEAFASLGAVTPGLVVGQARRADQQRSVLVFSGQGCQWAGMGRALHETEPLFRERLGAVDECFSALAGWSIAKAMAEQPDSRLLETEVAQPAIFAVQVALAAVLEARGLLPEAVIGHSVGEIAAACVAGALSLEDATRLAFLRGRAAQRARGGGQMLVVGLPAEELAGELQASLSIAAINSPKGTVVSGEPADVGALKARLEARGVRCHLMAMPFAFHSPQMEPLQPGLREALAWLRPAAGRDIAFYSTSLGQHVSPEELGPAYWVAQLRNPVRFADAVDAALADGFGTFVEVGPHAVLLGDLVRCLDARSVEGCVVGAQDRATSGDLALASALARLFVAGAAVRLNDREASEGPRCVTLPPYPFQLSRHWTEVGLDVGRRGETEAAEPQALRSDSSELGTSGRWPLGGRAIRTPGTSVHHVLSVGPQHQPFLADHLVFGRVVVPGAFYLAVVLALGNDRWPGLALEVSNAEFLRAIALSEGETVELHALLTPVASGEGYRFELCTWGGAEGQGWTTHARGELRPLSEGPGDLPRPEALETKATLPVDRAALLGALSSMQIGWGPRWQWLQSGRVGGGAAVAELSPTYEGAHDEAPLHPSLLDNGFAVGLLSRLAEVGDDVPRLPFAVERLRWWRAPSGGVRCSAVQRAGGEVADFVLADATGGVVAEVSGFVARRAPRALFLPQPAERSAGAVFRLDWHEETPSSPAAAAHATTTPGSGASAEAWVLVAPPGSRWAEAVAARLGRCTVTEPHRLAEALEQAGAGSRVVCLWETRADEDVPRAALRLATEGLAVIHALEKRGASRLWWVTAGAVAALIGEPVSPAAATLWGLGRTLMQEHPELRCTLLDVERASDPERAAESVWQELRAGNDEPQVALRAGRRHVARLVAARAGEGLPVPDASSYRLALGQKGALETLRLDGEERRAPGPGEVEIEVTASGLNFRTVFDALGLFPGDAGPMGGDCAGIVTAVGAGVEMLSVGDRVVTMAPISRFVTVDARAVVRVDMALGTALSPAQAATVPAAFVTAWLALVELGRVKPGERVLIHAAAGGVGMAAVQVARWLGAEVFATAHPSKWGAVEALGVPRTHLASSREPGFAEAFERLVGARGFDVVLNALSGAFVDEGLSLLRPGGRFLEMGKVELRSPDAVAAAHPGVGYQAFDIVELGPERTQAILEKVVAAISAGHLRPLPAQTFPVTEAEAAFRAMAQGKHTGKLVLLPARSPRLSGGTVLVTGGLGALGLHVARQLAKEGAGHLVLTGRRGMATPGAAEAVAELEALGAKVTVAAVDVSDRNQVEQLLQGIGEDRPLRGVVHAAGVLDDGVLSEQTAERLGRAMAPKVLGAWHLHELTRHTALDFFVLFSSLSGLLGAPGQGNYAAANAFLDALAAERRAEGLAGQSLAWGPWAEGGMAAQLDTARRTRLGRQGVKELAPEQGLALLSAALRRPEAQLALVPLDLVALGQTFGPSVPPVWRSLVGAPAAAGADDQGAWAARLAAMPPERRLGEVTLFVKTEIARVLSLGSASAIPDNRPLKDLGLDSLIAVELRNTLGKRVQKTLPATLAFDYPTVAAIATYLVDEVLGSKAEAAVEGEGLADDAALWSELRSIKIADLRRAGLLAPLLELARASAAASPPKAAVDEVDIDQMGLDDLVGMIAGDGAHMLREEED